MGGMHSEKEQYWKGDVERDCLTSNELGKIEIYAAYRFWEVQNNTSVDHDTVKGVEIAGKEAGISFELLQIFSRDTMESFVSLRGELGRSWSGAFLDWDIEVCLVRSSKLLRSFTPTP